MSLIESGQDFNNAKSICFANNAKGIGLSKKIPENIINLITEYLEFCERCELNIEPDTNVYCSDCKYLVCKACADFWKTCNDCGSTYCKNCGDFKKVGDEYFCEDCVHGECYNCDKILIDEPDCCEECYNKLCEECIQQCELCGAKHCEDCEHSYYCQFE